MVKNSSAKNSVEDIEDLLNGIDIQSMERPNSEKLIKTIPNVETIPNIDYGKGEFSNGPGAGKIYIKTWGCTHNSSDSEYMAGMLAAYGFTLVDDKTDADLWILNSCTVKNPAEDHFRNEINSAKSSGKYLVLAGCVPQGAPKSDLIEGFSIIGVQQIDRIVEVVQETLNGNTVRLLGVRKENGKKSGGAPLNLPKIRRNKLVEIIAINTGCLNQCTYCKTKHARGNLGSYPVEEIVQRAQQAFNEGVVEIWLTSEDTGTYGRDIGTNLPTLMWRLISIVPKRCRLRLGMTNPPYILEHAEEMANILNHPAVYKFLHIPIQSGSDTVLFEMKREYSRNDFETLVDFLKKRVPGLTIATDIICGYPTETDDDFAETLSICEKYKFPSLFINQFYPRPGTPASLLPQLDKKAVKNRTKTLSDYFRSYNPYDNRVGRKYDVLLTDKMEDKKMYVGHNEFYEQVLIPFDLLKTGQCPMGQMATVEIVKSTKFSMIAKPARPDSNLFYLALVALLITVLLRTLLVLYKSPEK